MKEFTKLTFKPVTKFSGELTKWATVCFCVPGTSVDITIDNNLTTIKVTHALDEPYDMLVPPLLSDAYLLIDRGVNYTKLVFDTRRVNLTGLNYESTNVESYCTKRRYT